MTLHTYGEWYSEFTCPQCNTLYLPYSREAACPACGRLEDRDSDFISTAISSIEKNLKDNDSYLPSAWNVGCFSDHILYLVFQVGSDYRIRQGEFKDFDSYVPEILEIFDYGDHVHIKQNLRDTLLAINKVRAFG